MDDPELDKEKCSGQYYDNFKNLNVDDWLNKNQCSISLFCIF